MGRHGQIRVRLYGPFGVWSADGEEIALKGSKAIALVAMLATAPDGRRKRAWLQKALWGRSDQRHGRASLRQCLSLIKRMLGGDTFEILFHCTNDAVTLRLEAFELVGSASDGEFLEGIEVPTDLFASWVAERRDGARQIEFRTPAVPAAPSQDEEPAPTTSARSDKRMVPVVAVIPFTGVDQFGDGSLLGDAIAQDITRSLSRSPFMMVISHLSSRHQSLRSAELGELRQLLKADYVVTGSVRTSGERYRLDVDFVDAASGELFWSQHFEGRNKHFFDGGDETVDQVANAVTGAVFSASLAPMRLQRLPDIATHRLLNAGITLMHRPALGSFKAARGCFEELIERVPDQSLPRAWLARWFIHHVKQGSSFDPKADLAKAAESARRAVDRNPYCPFSLAMNGFVRHHTYQFNDAFDFHDAALSQDPSQAIAWLLSGVLHTFMGQGPQAVEKTEKARTLSPLDPHQYLFDSFAAGAHAVNGSYETALDLAERSLQSNPRYASTLRVRTFALEMLGRHEEASRTAREIMQIEPTFSVSQYRTNHPSANYETGAMWADVLGRAGIPQH
ncbi:MAG: hypothetical protein AcusKO_31380 [Acuticoccus sp.]